MTQNMYRSKTKLKLRKTITNVKKQNDDDDDDNNGALYLLY